MPGEKMSFENMKIRVRMGLGFGLILALALLAAGLGLLRMATIQGHLDRVAGSHMVKIKRVSEMRDALQTAAISARNLVLLTDDEAMESAAKQVQEQRKRYAEASGKLAALVTGEAEKALFARIAAARAQTDPSLDKAMGFALGNPIAATQTLIDEVHPAQSLWIKALEDMARFQEKASAQALADAEAAYAGARALVLAMAGLSLVLGALVAWRLTRSITGPLNTAVNLARAIAGGDLTQRIEARSTNETGQLMQALKDMNESLVRIVGQVRSGTDSVATASGQISSGNLDLSSRTEQQASSLEETASSMEELTSTVRQNAENARQANQLVVSTADVAVKGGQVVGQVVDTMASIKESSRKIADIIGTSSVSSTALRSRPTSLL